MVRRPALVSVCASLLLGVGCYNYPEVPKCEPLYEGVATEEAWYTMVYALKQPMDSSLAPVIMSPTEGQSFATDARPPRFSWASPLRGALERDSPSRLARARPPPSRNPLVWLGELLLPRAEAHDSIPYTGDIYLMQVFIPSRECPLEVLTSELSWQWDEDSWRTLSEAVGQPLSLQVTSAFLQFNRLKEGPYRQTALRSFRLHPPAP